MLLSASFSSSSVGRGMEKVLKSSDLWASVSSSQVYFIVVYG